MCGSHRRLWGVTVAVIGLLAAATGMTAARRSAEAQENLPAGRKLAFLVGIKKYDHAALHDLDFPENDVTELAGLLKSQNFEVVVLTTALAKDDPTAAPTAENIRTR